MLIVTCMRYTYARMHARGKSPHNPPSGMYVMFTLRASWGSITEVVRCHPYTLCTPNNTPGVVIIIVRRKDTCMQLHVYIRTYIHVASMLCTCIRISRSASQTTYRWPRAAYCTCTLPWIQYDWRHGVSERLFVQSVQITEADHKSYRKAVHK